MSTPDLFTITEAAVVLRIGRTTAYDLARRDLATGGGEGLGVIRIGGQLRVPRAALERLIGAPVTGPEPAGITPAGITPAGAGNVRGDADAVVLAGVPDFVPDPVDRPSATFRNRRRLTSVEQLRFDA